MNASERMAIANLPPFNFAVFSQGDWICLVHLESADAQAETTLRVSSGFEYVGAIGINRGEPTVLIEADRHAAQMIIAGQLFAERLGIFVQRFQEQQKGPNAHRLD